MLHGMDQSYIATPKDTVKRYSSRATGWVVVYPCVRPSSSRVAGLLPSPARWRH